MKKIAIIAIGFLSFPLLASAATVSAPITTVQGLVDLLCAIFGWMFYGLMALSVIVIVLAAFNYTTANGSAEKVSKANKMILYAAIGIAVALLAKGVPLIVGDFLGANASGLSTCSGGTSVNSTIQYGGPVN